MELDGTAMNVIMVILIIILLVANIYFRRRKEEKTPLGKVIRILYEVGHNQRTIESFEFHRGRKKFKTGGWRRNKNKIDFLPSELQAALAKAFEMAEEFNERINAAKKFGSDSYMVGIDTEKLKEPFAKSDEKLREWLQENSQNPEYAPKRRGLLG